MKHPTRHGLLSDHAGRLSIPADNNIRTSYQYGKHIQFPVTCSGKSQRRLILTLEGNIIREFSVDNRNLTIGRRHGNDIQLNDPLLGRKHALVMSDSSQVVIEDLASTNGTLVNGCRIKKATLEHGDIIQIGHYQLTYLCEQDIPYNPDLFVKVEPDETAIINTDKTSQKNEMNNCSLGGLKVISKKQQQPIPVMELHKTINIIGFRGKRMALISRETNGYTISAIEGSHSRRARDIPLLNGRKLENQQIPLHPGDLLTIAGYDIEHCLVK